LGIEIQVDQDHESTSFVRNGTFPTLVTGILPDGVGGVYVSAEEPKDAAQIIGWTDAARRNTNDMRLRLEQAHLDKIIAAGLAKMGKEDF
jgi:hypothetical protein